MKLNVENSGDAEADGQDEQLAVKDVQRKLVVKQHAHRDFDIDRHYYDSNGDVIDPSLDIGTFLYFLALLVHVDLGISVIFINLGAKSLQNDDKVDYEAHLS